MAASTGLSDVVMLLLERKADKDKLDGNGRGILQLAQKCQGKGQHLATVLKTQYGCKQTYGKGRPKDEQTRGQFSSELRNETGPAHKKGKKGGDGRGKSSGYEPHASHQQQQQPPPWNEGKGKGAKGEGKGAKGGSKGGKGKGAKGRKKGY